MAVDQYRTALGPPPTSMIDLSPYLTPLVRYVLAILRSDHLGGTVPDGEVRVDDLVELWSAGAVHLPLVAIQYAEVAQELHRTALSQEAAFRRSIGGPGRLYSAWTSLRDLTQNQIAVRTHGNLINAGDALTKIADAYARTEDVNAGQLREYEQRIADIGNGRVEVEGREGWVRRPPYVPEAPSSSDPHPERPPARIGGGV